MGAQTSYTEQLAAMAGLSHGIDNKFETGVNDLGKVRNLHTLTIGTAADQDYAHTVDGIAVSFTRAAGETTQAIRDAVLAAARATQALEGVAFYNPSGTDDILITAVTAGTAITVLESSANQTLVETTVNVALESIGFGLGVVRGTVSAKSVTLPSAAGGMFRGFVEYTHSAVDPSAAGAAEASPGQNLSIIRRGAMWVPFVDGAQGAPVEGDDCYLVFSGAGNIGKVTNDQGGTLQVITITVATVTNDGRYAFEIDGRVVEFTADGSATAQEVVDGLVAAVNAIADLDFVGVDGAGDTIVITSDKTVTFAEIADPGTDVSIAESTAPAPLTHVAQHLGSNVKFARVNSALGLALVEINLP